MAQRKNRRPHTALLLVDFISLFDFEGGARLAPRALRAAHATVQLKAHMAKCGYPCIYTNDNFGNWKSEFSALVAQCKRRKGAAQTISELLLPKKDDLAILKPRHSAFYGTPLDFLLEALGVRRLVIAGVAVDMCVMATAQDAHVRKFELSIPSNCVAGFTASREKTALAMMARTIGADIRAFQNAL